MSWIINKKSVSVVNNTYGDLLNLLLYVLIPFFSDLLQPPKIKCFINFVTSVPLEKIEEPLKSFVWEFDKVLLWPLLLHY